MSLRTSNNKTIEVPDGNHKMINISINEYITGINSFDISMDTLSICKKFNINNIKILCCAATTTINFLKTLRGNKMYKKYNKECNLLESYKIGIQPVYTELIRKNIAYIKWVIYINIKNNNINIDLAYYIAMISGICLYFNELDLIKISNNNNNNNYNDSHNNYEYMKNLSKTYTINEF